MRFAFYGRVSTEDQQDPKASRNWQITRARQLIEPADGEIVAEFFDIGQSRSLPWSRRPEAARLLEALGNSSRDFNAVVIGEPQRAFYGNQFGLTFPVFVHYSVELWVPEVGGAIDPGSDAHEIVMSLYGGMSKGERNRIKTRVRSAMAAQAAMEGRFLGGRPPYGYQLVDAGPHPNQAKAAAGQRAKQLEPNPATAPVVRRIFREFLGGRGLRAIANGLTAEGILSPSASDPDRNRHRLANGPEWRFTAVRSILENPRYTGYQVWNKQRRDEILIDVNDVGLGHQIRMRWNDPSEWVWSEEPSHEALVTREDWEAVQTRFQGNKRRYTRTPKERRHYVLAGRLLCGQCGRRMEGTWNHDRPYYRCQIPRDDPANNADHPATIYVREDRIVPHLDSWVGELFTDEHLDDTCAKLADAAQPDSDQEAQERQIKERIRKLDQELDSYRAIVRTEPEAASAVGRWIAETNQERRRLEALLGRSPTVTLTAEDIKALVASLQDITATLAAADPADKAKVYAEMGIDITYHQDGRVVFESRPRVVESSVGEPWEPPVDQAWRLKPWGSKDGG
ncbi:MAG TPA: recombinase family protein [Acidimicrobiia bacterium]|nr:recombinase family protein [Acidimicrobiia bacterium]